ncbi:MAG TPA: PilZ domain-containing protein [Sphingomicrobium sp.]
MDGEPGDILTGRQAGTMALWPRKSDRVSVEAEIVIRRLRDHNFRVRVYDISRHGCRVDFISRPQLDDRAWIKFEGLEGLEASVCWTQDFTAGMQFIKPIHPAVFDRLVSKLA